MTPSMAIEPFDDVAGEGSGAAEMVIHGIIVLVA